MTQVIYETEIEIDDKYVGSRDVPVRVFAEVVTVGSDIYGTGDSPDEVDVNIDSVELYDHYSPEPDGVEVVHRLDDFTIEYLKDEAIRRTA